MIVQPAPVVAQEGPPPAMVDELTAQARSNLSLARLPDGSNVPSETPEELALPIAPRTLEVQTINRALLSAAMDVCELDSDQLSFLPYMRELRESERYSDKQMAYIGLLHGISMGVLTDMIPSTICTDEVMAEMIYEGSTTPITTP